MSAYLMIAIFVNSPFEDEIRMECNMVKLNTKKMGEVCLLENYSNSIFDAEDTDIEVVNGNSSETLHMTGKGIIKVKDNYVYCFGLVAKKQSN